MNGAILDITSPVAESSPNTTQPPDDRIIRLPIANGNPNVMWVAALGGSPVVELWFAPLADATSPTPTWVRLSLTGAAQFTVPAGDAAIIAVTAISWQGFVPSDVPLFLRVQALGGATRIFAGLTRG
jgi:hypothetical protein